MDIEEYAQYPGWSADQLSNILHISVLATEMTFPSLKMIKRFSTKLILT
jgi:hypothetical protein